MHCHILPILPSVCDPNLATASFQYYSAQQIRAMKLGYSKINNIDTAHKYSRSLDFSTRSYSKTHLDQIYDHTNIIQMDASITNDSASIKTTQDYSSSFSSSFSPRKRNDIDDVHHQDEAENVDGENVVRKLGDNKAAFGSNNNSAEAVLWRNRSVSSMSAVKRVFSMRRSSSVSERYCRIHDQSVTLASPVDDEEFEEDDKNKRSAKKKHGGGKILKACKRFFRLH